MAGMPAVRVTLLLWFAVSRDGETFIHHLPWWLWVTSLSVGRLLTSPSPHLTHTPTHLHNADTASPILILYSTHSQPHPHLYSNAHSLSHHQSLDPPHQYYNAPQVTLTYLPSFTTQCFSSYCYILCLPNSEAYENYFLKFKQFSKYPYNRKNEEDPSNS